MKHQMLITQSEVDVYEALTVVLPVPQSPAQSPGSPLEDQSRVVFSSGCTYICLRGVNFFFAAFCFHSATLRDIQQAPVCQLFGGVLVCGSPFPAFGGQEL